MRLIKSSIDKWSLLISNFGNDNSIFSPPHYTYVDALTKYINYLYPLFERAKVQSEFEFIKSLLRIKGMGNIMYNPFETTKIAISGITQLQSIVEDYYTAKNLQLWIYGHIIEASEPYEIIYNMLDISRGGRCNFNCFPNSEKGRPQTPGQKISVLEKLSKEVGYAEVAVPLKEIWDRDLRNSIFHADYALIGGDIYISYNNNSFRGMKLTKSYCHDEHLTLLNRSLAYFGAIEGLFSYYISNYTKSRVIEVHPGFSNERDLRAIIIVRQGHGLAGLKSTWTQDQIRNGKIPFRLGIFSSKEKALLDADASLSVLPNLNT